MSSPRQEKDDERAVVRRQHSFALEALPTLGEAEELLSANQNKQFLVEKTNELISAAVEAGFRNVDDIAYQMELITALRVEQQVSSGKVVVRNLRDFDVKGAGCFLTESAIVPIERIYAENQFQGRDASGEVITTDEPLYYRLYRG